MKNETDGQATVMYVYRISSLDHSSRKYGNCEICNKYVTDVHLQVESKEVTTELGVNFIRTGDAFGHEECLRGIRKTPHYEQTAEEYQTHKAIMREKKMNTRKDVMQTVNR